MIYTINIDRSRDLAIEGANMLKLKDSTLLKTHNYINGRWVTGSAGTIDVSNPANNAMLTTVANGNASDAVQAVEAASSAFQNWSRMPAKQRAILLRNWYELIMANADNLCTQK